MFAHCFCRNARSAHSTSLHQRRKEQNKIDGTDRKWNNKNHQAQQKKNQIIHKN